MKAEKVIGIIILVVLLVLGAMLIYSGIQDLQDDNDDDNTDDDIVIVISDDDDDDDNSSNSAPVLDDIDDIEIEEGDKLTITASATDADGDDLTYSFSGVADAEIDDNKFEWQTWGDDAGEYKVTVTVSDGEDEDSTSFTIYVENDDDADQNDDDDDDPVSTNDEYDLIVSSLVFDRLIENTEQAVYNVEVTNEGADDISDEIEISGELTFDSNSYTASNSVQDLASGETKTMTLYFETPEVITELYTNDVDLSCEVIVDNNENIDETDENNNDQTMTHTINTGYFDKDLEIESVTAYKDTDDREVKFYVKTVNNGNYDVENYELELDLTILGLHGLPNVEVTKKAKVNDVVSAGGYDYYIYTIDLTDYYQIFDPSFLVFDLDMTVDPNNQIDETDETNNEGSYFGSWNSMPEAFDWDDAEIALNPNLPDFSEDNLWDDVEWAPAPF